MRWELTVTNFLYLASSQSDARIARTACFLSRALRTSLSPLTSPIPRRTRVQSVNFSINPRADQGTRLSQKQAPSPTVVSLRLLDHTLDGIVDVVGLSFLLNFLSLNFLLAEAVNKDSTRLATVMKAWRGGPAFRTGAETTTYLSSTSDMVGDGVFDLSVKFVNELNTSALHFFLCASAICAA